jgi:uncharacterized protein (DUF433 family)
MAEEYIKQRDGGYWIKGSRVSLDSIVYAFLAGQTAESIAQSFPVLSLREVYGAITFYLENREHVDDYLTQTRADFEAARTASREADPAFYLKCADLWRRAQAVK